MPDTNFNGRKTRMARKVRRLTFAPSSGNKAIILIKKSTSINHVLFNLCILCRNFYAYAVTITKKSIIFHAFLKYEFSCKIKPNAIILHDASTQNMPRKNGSVASNFIASVVRSPFGKCCSSAITKQFAMIVTRIVYSNGGQSMMKRATARNGWSSVNKNNDVGPGGGTGTSVGCTTSTFTFCREVVVVCVDTFALWFDAGASCAASLFIQSDIGHIIEN